MKAQTKQNWANGFKALISNNAVMDSAKNTPWYIALIIALVSAFIPVIPITVSNAQAYGSSFLSSYSENMETPLTSVCLDLLAENKEFTVENSELSYTINGVKQTNIMSEEDICLKSYEATRDGVTQIDFQLYYTTALSSNKTSDPTLNDLVKDYIESDKNTYVIGTTTKKSSDDAEDTQYYMPSYLVLSKTAVYCVLKKPDSTTNYNYTKYTGNWKHTATGTKLLENSLTMADSSLAELSSSEDVACVLKTWKGYFDESYLTQKDFNVKFSLLVYFAIYLAMIGFMGLMMFILTRGKKNMFNYLKFGMCNKMAAWASITPALLSLILGFILTSYAMMYFIIFIGIRVMWMSMKQLRPQY